MTLDLCFQGNLSDLGRLMMQGSFSVWTEHKKGHAKVKDLARFKPMQRHLFLHEKSLLFCKKREENGEGYEKAPSYSFKHSLNVSPECQRQRILKFIYYFSDMEISRTGKSREDLSFLNAHVICMFNLCFVLCK